MHMSVTLNRYSSNISSFLLTPVVVSVIGVLVYFVSGKSLLVVLVYFVWVIISLLVLIGYMIAIAAIEVGSIKDYIKSVREKLDAAEDSSKIK